MNEGFRPPPWLLDYLRTTPMAWITRTGQIDWQRRRHYTTVKHTRRYLIARHVFGLAWNALTGLGRRHKFLVELETEDDYGSSTLGIDPANDYGVTVFDETEAEYAERSKGFPKTIVIPRSGNGSDILPDPTQ